MPLSSCSARILEIRKCRASERAENSLALSVRLNFVVFWSFGIGIQ